LTDRPGEMDERDVEARFASIVAAWEVPTARGGTSDDPDPADLEAADGGGAHDVHDDDRDDSDGEEPHGETSGADDEAETGPATTARPPWVNPSPLDVVVPASSWRVATPPGGGQREGESGTPTDDDEHFEPAPVSLPPQEDLHFWGAVVGLVGGPLLLLYVALARPFHSDRWFAAGVVLSLVGFGLLVLRQPRHRDPSDDDDGARV
jgi:hypothetical protein